MPLPGNPLRRSHLRDIIEHTQKLTGCEIERAYVDKGSRGRTRKIQAASLSLGRSAASSARLATI
jgi:hypothetical protein